jgi:hypothetical protein
MKVAWVCVLMVPLIFAGCAKKSTVPESTPAATEAATNSSAETTTAAPAGAGKTYTITLNAENGSTESGKATIVTTPDAQYTISVSLSNLPAGAQQNAGLYNGSCATVTSPLTAEVMQDISRWQTLGIVSSGKASQPEGNIAMASGPNDLNGKAVVVILSSLDRKVVSCGDIKITP